MGEGVDCWRKVLLHSVRLYPHWPSTSYQYLYSNQSALLAFTLPASWQPGAGVSIVATHIDSPNLRIRPVSKRSKAGYLQVGVETYGGGLWHTWFDRDLSLAGRVVVGKDGEYRSRLVKVERPILRIPNLAVHCALISISTQIHIGHPAVARTWHRCGPVPVLLFLHAHVCFF